MKKKNELYYLIENKINNMWLCNNQEDLVIDVKDALRFYLKEEAERFKEDNNLTDFKVTEHVDIDWGNYVKGY